MDINESRADKQEYFHLNRLFAEKTPVITPLFMFNLWSLFFYIVLSITFYTVYLLLPNINNIIKRISKAKHA